MPIINLFVNHWPAFLEGTLTFAGCGMIIRSFDNGEEDLKVVGILLCLLSIVVCIATGGVT